MLYISVRCLPHVFFGEAGACFSLSCRPFIYLKVPVRGLFLKLWLGSSGSELSLLLETLYKMYTAPKLMMEPKLETEP